MAGPGRAAAPEPPLVRPAAAAIRARRSPPLRPALSPHPAAQVDARRLNGAAASLLGECASERKRIAHHDQAPDPAAIRRRRSRGVRGLSPRSPGRAVPVVERNRHRASECCLFAASKPSHLRLAASGFKSRLPMLRTTACWGTSVYAFILLGIRPKSALHWLARAKDAGSHSRPSIAF